jgi:crossover junction endodeoxyribonuclease RusA
MHGIMFTLELPYPPSVNHHFSIYRGRPILSKEVKAYRHLVRQRLWSAGVKPMSGPLAVQVDAFPPDRRRRDIDNILKILLDALQHGNAFYDDSQIVDLRARKLEHTAGGKVLVKIQEIVEQDAKSLDRV